MFWLWRPQSIQQSLDGSSKDGAIRGEERGRFRIGEKTAYIADPKGKDGAIKREEEQKEERRRLGAEYSDVLRRQTNVWVEFGLHADVPP